MAINKIQISKIFALPTEPSKATLNRFWYDTTNKILKHYDGTSWVPLQVHADDVVVLPNGDTKSLTECLSIIGDGLDSLETSKQNKLLYYSETSGVPSARIKLDGSVAEGNGTTATGPWSHAEGTSTQARNPNCHAEGSYTIASGHISHAEGEHTIASGDYQHVQGKYNIEDSGNRYADIIGNGSTDDNRSNAQTVSWDGISWSQTDVRAGGTDQDSAAHSLSAKQNATDNNLTTTNKTIVGAINEIENKVLDSRLSKLSAGTLYFNSGKLSGANFAVPTFPFSICATVRIDAWRGASEHSQPIFQYGELGSGTGSIFSISFVNGDDNPRLRLAITDKIDGANKSSDITCALDLSTFLGKMHTIIGICRAVTAEALNWDIYIDGAKQNIASSAKNAIVSSLSGTRAWAVNTSNYNFSSQPASANPMMLRNLCIFNFDVSAEGSPYSIADYEAGRLIPPSLIGNQFTGMYGSGWSVSGDTATCSGSLANTYLRVTGGSIPIGFDYEFTVDLDLTFSGDAMLEVYTVCSKAVAEIYNYADGSTVEKNSAKDGAFYGNASVGITASGHYKITFKCQDFYGALPNFGKPQLVIGALTQGTVVLSDTRYDRAFLALENYTIARNATTTLVKDASGNSNDATVKVSSGGYVAGDNDQSIKVFVDEIKTQTSLTSLQFNVYGTDKKIIPGKYMRLIFSQDSNGNVTPTYVSEEEWNDVYDV